MTKRNPPEPHSTATLKPSRSPAPLFRTVTQRMGEEGRKGASDAARTILEKLAQIETAEKPHNEHS